MSDPRRTEIYAAGILLAAGVWLTEQAGWPFEASAALQVLVVRATDFAFDAPERLQAGHVTLRLQNDGLVPHQAWVVRLAEGRTLRDLERDLAEQGGAGGGLLPHWIDPVGGPSAVSAGEAAEVTLDLRPGRYAMLCLMPLGDGALALMKGMYRAFEVTEGPSGTPSPRSDAAVTLTERSLAERGRLRRGSVHVRVTNASSTTRELRVYRLTASNGADAMRSWLATEMGAAPAPSVGGVFGLPPRGTSVLALTLDRGEYVLVSRPALTPAGSRHSAPTFLRPVRID
jgi:hypothetical protein